MPRHLPGHYIYRAFRTRIVHATMSAIVLIPKLTVFNAD